MLESIFNLIKKYHVSIILIAVYYILSNAFFGYFCPSQVIFGLPCPACGMTRAFFSLLRLDLISAFDYHPMIFPVIPLVLAYFYFKIKAPKRINLLFYPALTVIIVSFVLFGYRVLNTPGQEPIVFNKHNILNIFNR